MNNNKIKIVYLLSGKSIGEYMFLIRLDDASENMNIENWIRIKIILDKWDIKPIYGIIPQNADPGLLKYSYIPDFWMLMKQWQDEGWTPALHGYEHVYITNDGGINPVQNRSEFAGLDFQTQCMKIKKGNSILIDHGIYPEIFFAPSHTFDNNTVRALLTESNIRVICDTVANDIYYLNGIHFIPQQCGSCRNLPLHLVTFCYHPNTMDDEDFVKLEKFVGKYFWKFSSFSNQLIKEKRKYNAIDKMLMKMYFLVRKLRS